MYGFRHYLCLLRSPNASDCGNSFPIMAQDTWVAPTVEAISEQGDVVDADLDFDDVVGEVSPLGWGVVSSDELLSVLAQDIGITVEDLQSHKTDDTQCVLMWLQHANRQCVIIDVDACRRHQPPRAKCVTALFHNHRRIKPQVARTSSYCIPIFLTLMIAMSWLQPEILTLQYGLFVAQLACATLFTLWRPTVTKPQPSHAQGPRRTSSRRLRDPRSHWKRRPMRAHITSPNHSSTKAMLSESCLLCLVTRQSKTMRCAIVSGMHISLSLGCASPMPRKMRRLWPSNP